MSIEISKEIDPEVRLKLICDAIISHFKSNSETKKFGRQSIASIFDGRCDAKEVEEAIQWLIDERYIKKLGAFVIGFGTGEGLKEYVLSDYDPFALKANSPKVTTAKPVLREEVKPSPELVAVKARQSKPQEIGVDTYKPARVSDWHAPSISEQVNDELNELKQCVSKPRKEITDLDLKVNAIEKLITCVGPATSSVLNMIIDDLRQGVEA